MTITSRDWEKLEQAFTPYQARCTWEERDGGEILLTFQSRQDWQAFSSQVKNLGIPFRGSFHFKELIILKS